MPDENISSRFFVNEGLDFASLLILKRSFVAFYTDLKYQAARYGLLLIAR